jgi:putative oxidoreductase
MSSAPARLLVASSRARWRTVALWILQVALGAAFLIAGASKIAGAAPMVALFDAIGIGTWFRYLTGSLEISGAILLFTPVLAGVGAIGLIGIMAGAILTHLFALHTSPAAPMMILVALTIVAYARRAEISHVVSRLRGRQPVARLDH